MVVGGLVYLDKIKNIRESLKRGILREIKANAQLWKPRVSCILKVSHMYAGFFLVRRNNARPSRPTALPPPPTSTIPTVPTTLAISIPCKSSCSSPTKWSPTRPQNRGAPTPTHTHKGVVGHPPLHRPPQLTHRSPPLTHSSPRLAAHYPISS